MFLTCAVNLTVVIIEQLCCQYYIIATVYQHVLHVSSIFAVHLKSILFVIATMEGGILHHAQR